GIGIHKEDLPNIFNRFYRSNNHINKKNDGSGLGLTITKSLVEAHGGKITVESILGKGTTFNIILPVK
ncbi:ATP-binding protein, partial [Anaerosalibacter bizertensis]|nr:ATP-binding protein [Anaerosalibacter bizertensis]